MYVEDSQGNDDGEIIGLKLDKYYNASTLEVHVTKFFCDEKEADSFMLSM